MSKNTNLSFLTDYITADITNGRIGINNASPAYAFDVTGLERSRGTTASDTAPLGSELAAVTGTGTNWTLAGTNLNVGGYTHTVGSTTALTTSLAAVAGTYYQITYTITGRTAGSITIAYGGTSTAGITATGATGPLASSTAVLTITPTTDFNGTVVLSIKSIGASSASTTFANSAGASNIELRASNIVTNTFIGLNAGLINTTGASNTFLGNGAGSSNTTGGNNIFIGKEAGKNNTIGGSNFFMGDSAGFNNTTGGNIVAIGVNAYLNGTTGTQNVVIGTQALAQNTVTSANAVVGFQSLSDLTSGGGNTSLGNQSGRFIADGTTRATSLSNSVLLGASTKPLSQGNDNTIVIGTNSVGLGSNTTVLGNSSTVTTAIYGNLGLGTTAVSSLLTLSQSAFNKTTLGDARVIRLENSDPTVQLNSRQEIGFGYSTAYQPVVIGHQITNNTDFTNGSFYIAVRSGVGNTAPVQALTVIPGGNVGIGTTTPSQKLDVNGTIKAAGAFVQATGNIFIGDWTGFYDVSTSTSKVYLLQLVPTDSIPLLNYRLFGVIQTNTTSGTYYFTTISSQTMEVRFVGNTIQVRITNGNGYYFNWSITQLC